MRLLDLEPQLLKRVDDAHWKMVDALAEADGVQFVCPGCLAKNNMSRPGVHSVVCWAPNVPQTTSPTPGRWEMHGTGLADLTLVAGSSSVKVGEPPCAHFFVRNGNIEQA